MVFASPIQLLRRFLPIVCILFTSISCFGATAFLTVQSTPYDRQMNRVLPDLNLAYIQSAGSISLMAVSHLMMQLRDMPYEYSSRWQTPTEVSSAQTADCKGKALALYAQMRRNGVKNVRVVIGKRHLFDSGTHAWLEWQTKEGSYVLDPTFNDMPTRTAEFGSATYVPLFAYDGAHKYRANGAGSIAPSVNVATGMYIPSHTALSLTEPVLAGAGPKPSVSATPVRLATTQHLQLNAHRTVSTARRSLSNVEGVTKTRSTTSKAKSVVSTHRRSAGAGKRLLAKKSHTRHRGHIASKAKLRHAKSPVISQNEKFVIPTDPTRLPP